MFGVCGRFAKVLLNFSAALELPLGNQLQLIMPLE